MHQFKCSTGHRATKIKWFPLILLIILFCSFFYFRLHHYLTFNILKAYQSHAQEWTIAHYKSAVSLYILIYIILVAAAIPCATLFTLLGGFLFGGVAVFYAIFSTTFGGMILYLAIRTSIGEGIVQKSSGWIKKMEHGFQKNAFNYLLMLRLIPIFPCWISNIAAGALNIPMRTFIFATILGIAPTTFIYVMAGRGLDKFIATESTPSLTMLLQPSILLPFLGLAILSLFPVIYKYFKKTPLNEKEE